jgi:hypothetical protein
VIGLLLFTPVLAWNADHHWVGLLRQGGRVGDWHPLRAVGFLGELIGGQIGLATPLVWVLCMIGLAAGVSRACTRRDPAWSLLTALSLPPVLVFIQHAVGDRVQGNWPAIIYPSLAIAAGGAIRDRRWIVAASALGLAITLLVYGQVLTGWLPVPPRLDPIAIRLAGWTALGRQIEATASVNAVSFVAAENYALAAELAWSTQGRIAIVGTDQRWRLTALPTFPIAGQVGLLVRDVRRLDPPDPAVWATAQRLDDVVRPASGTPGFAVYRVTAAQHAEPGELISPVRQTKSSQAIGG